MTAALLAAALGVGWWTSAQAADEVGLLVRDERGAVSLVDPDDGSVAFNLDDAFPTPDRSSLLTTVLDDGDTVLQSRDARTGAVTGSTTLDGALHVRSVSPRGGAVVLMPGPRPDSLYDPQPRTRTDITIAYLDDRPSQRFRLPGNIEPEMMSLDERTLFVLDFQPPTDPTSYSVRKLDVATGQMSDTHSFQVDLQPKMAGTARAQVLHPDGRFLYTLYTLPSDQPIHDIDVSGQAERYAFVHVISLDDGWSHCIFLPIPFGTTDEATIGMTISPDGERLLVGDPAIGQVAEIDAHELSVTAVHDVPQLRDTGDRAVLAVAPDGAVFVSVGWSVVELDPATFAPVWALSPVTGSVTGLSATDEQLRIATGGQIVLFDRTSRVETGVIRGPGRGTVDLLGPPSGSVVEFPLECAC